MRIPESPVLEIGLSKIKSLAGPLPGSGLLCPLNLGFLGVPDGFWNRSNFAVVAGGGGGRGCSSPAGCRPHQASPGYPCSVTPRYVAIHHYPSRRRFIPNIPVSSSPRPPRSCHPKPPCPQLPATVTPALAPDATSADPRLPGAKRDLSPPRVLGPASPPGCRNGAPSPARPGAARDASAGLAAAATLRAPAEGRGLGGGGGGGSEGGGEGGGSGSGGPCRGQSQEARRRKRSERRTRSMRGAAGPAAVKPAAPRAQGVAVASRAHRG